MVIRAARFVWGVRKVVCVRWCASSGILGGDFGNSVYALSVWPVKRGFTRGEYDEATVQ